MTQEEAQNLLFESIAQNNLEGVREALEARANVNHVYNDGMTPIHLVAEAGHRDILKELLRSGGNFEATNGNGETPLHSAARQGHLDIIMDLIGHANAYFRERRNHTSVAALQITSRAMDNIVRLGERTNDASRIEEGARHNFTTLETSNPLSSKFPQDDTMIKVLSYLDGHETPESRNTTLNNFGVNSVSQKLSQEAVEEYNTADPRRTFVERLDQQPEGMAMNGGCGCVIS